ncbi:MAG: sodium:solute symporter [Cytophagales bacterium]|nr:MAG: sodium:solute symporter [Cytophagales bacterium]
MSTTFIALVMILYFGALLIISYFTSRNATSDSFFTGDKSSKWYLVAFGMIGTSISGVTFISVPGAVGKLSFSYFQIVMGYVVGYLIIGLLLMPLYYRLNLVSIYTYLEQRFGYWSYKTGSAFFLLSRTLGSSLRLYLAASVLQIFLFDRLEIPFYITVTFTILLIWIYTFKGGIKTIIWTDSFQTFFLIGSLCVSVHLIAQELNWSPYQLFIEVKNSSYSKIFFFEDYKSNQYFWKQFVSGIFIAIVMTGLDQDLMQKNLTCKNIKEAQKNMFWFTLTLVIVNILFLSLGALLYIYCAAHQIEIPNRTDDLFPLLALNHFGTFAGLCFLLGIIASSYASADSALASLTTSFCIDFLNFHKKEEKVKQKEKLLVHLGFSFVFLIVIVVFRFLNNQDVISQVLGIAGYTYGPLLGLFSFGILTDRKFKDTMALPISVFSPLVTYLLVSNSEYFFGGYKFSFEILILNGAICFMLMYFFSTKKLVISAKG